MAHFAKLDDNNLVIAVHVVNNEVITTEHGEDENIGIEFLSNLHNHFNWKQTSYNGSFRKNYAGIDFTYDENLDAFIPPQCHSEAALNEETCLWVCTNAEHEINVY